jgi:hypothetical protein
MALKKDELIADVSDQSKPATKDRNWLTHLTMCFALPILLGVSYRIASRTR